MKSKCSLFVLFCLLLLVIGCGAKTGKNESIIVSGEYFAGLTANQEVMALVNRFILDLEASRISQAYERLSKAFQSQHMTMIELSNLWQNLDDQHGAQYGFQQKTPIIQTQRAPFVYDVSMESFRNEPFILKFRIITDGKIFRLCGFGYESPSVPPKFFDACSM